MKRFSSLFLLFLPLILFSQTDTSSNGINWVEGLSWDEVMQKAKTENKFIFIDAYTTWCIPCKRMDKQIYTNDTVGKLFNEKFISIKVQMNKTDNDNDYIKSWYDNALKFSKEYAIIEYPSFIFLSPNGTIVEKEMGFKGVSDFLLLAENATKLGKTYNDPYHEYKVLAKEYLQGNKNYQQMTFMIKTALKIQDNDFAINVVKDHTNYVMTLPKEKRYTLDNIEMWSSFSLTSKTRIFHFFYKDGKMIDDVMHQQGFASKVVDQTIMDEVVKPFLEEQSKNSSFSMSGMYLTSKDLSSDNKEADWRKLKELIRKKFNAYYAKRNLLAARIEWYRRHRNFNAFVKYSLIQLNKYCYIENENPNRINNIAFDGFKYSTDKQVIDGYIEWMEKVVDKTPFDASNIDTYANLLYKAGKVEEAIKWEEKAAGLAPEVEDIKDALEKMKRGQPTCELWGYK